MRGAVVALLIVLAALPLGSQLGKPVPVSVVTDWSSRHVLFPQSKSISMMIDLQRDPRYWQAALGRLTPPPLPVRVQAPAGQNAVRLPGQGGRDWNLALGGSLGPQNTFPGKFVFDVTQPASCTADFLVTGINTAGSTTQANIIGLKNLYTNPSNTGYCSGTGPTVFFAYNVGPGSVYASVALSLGGTKVAFNENNAGSSRFHVVTIGTTGSNGTGPSAPVVPGTGNNAVDVALSLGEAVTNAPFVDYARDVAYVTTGGPPATTGHMHKFTGVFNGTPTEVTTGGWPIAHAGGLISTPVFDGVSRRVFFKAFDGHVHYVEDLGGSVSISATSFPIVSGTDGCARPLVVDSTNQRVYAYGTRASSTTGNTVVAQADTSLSTGSRVIVNVGYRNSAPTSFAPDLNNAYYTGSYSGAYLYVVGNSGTSNLVPALYSIGFNSSFKMNSSVANGPLALATNVSGLSSSPVTTFYNSRLAKDFLFIGISNNCSTSLTTGCMRSIDITSGFPTSGTINNVILVATGGTSGVTVDNNSAVAEASSAYYVTLTGNTLYKATQAELH